LNERTFAAEINADPIDIPRAALHFARAIAYPKLDIDDVLTRIDALAEAGQAFISFQQSPIEQAEALVDFLFIQERFRGNTRTYTDPRNSYLNEVLERRVGIPISLSVLYIDIARRLSIPAQGIGLPGHFIVSIPTQREIYYLDPFHGGSRLAEEDCTSLVRLTTGYDGQLQPEWLEPVSPRAILTRMLNNLRGVYMQQEDWGLALAVVEHLRILQPELPDLLRDSGLIYHRQGSLRLAVHHYEQYLSAAPNAPDAGAVRSHLEAAARNLALLN
jgi:regulator of sirC expression with transglutaminase-like and TPR domain